MVQKYSQTPKKDRIKFSNPLRDYSHLLSGRLVEGLIKMHSIIYDFKTLGSPSGAQNKKGKKNKKAVIDDKDAKPKKVLPSKKEMKFLRDCLLSC